MDEQAAVGPDDAIRLWEGTVRVIENALGAENPETLVSRGNLAAAYHEAGRVEDAISLWEESLRIEERVLGADHANTLVTRGNLAVSYRDAGRVER